MKYKIFQTILMVTKYFIYTFLGLIFTMSSILATSVSGQVKSVKDVVIQLNVSGAELDDVLRIIESKTNFRFFYTDRSIRSTVQVSLTKSKGTVADYLMEISSQTGIHFRQVNQTISVSKSKGNFTTREIEVILNQDTNITGKVTDENGEGLPGATVAVKGTAIGTVTDHEGNYSLNVPETADVLVFSFVGYETREVIISDQSSVDVSLELDLQGLQEVVVIGYQTVQKKDLTGSTAIIDPRASSRVTANSLAESIQGLAPGVTVRNGGAPGQGAVIEIRGVGSFSDTSPLYVIDGMLADANPTIPTNDIESIQILKDASAAAIYGSRAANGVVIITTKKGNDGPMQVSFSGKSGIQIVPKTWEVMNAEDFSAMQRIQYENSGLTPPALVDADFDPSVDTDWQDEMIQAGELHDYNLSLSGGSQTGSYMISGNYFGNEGVIKERAFDRYSFRVNSTSKIGERFTFGENLLLTHTIEQTPDAGNPFYDMPQMLPVIPVRSEDYITGSNPEGWGIGTPGAPNYSWNPVAINNLSHRTNNYSKLVGNAYLDVKLTDWISYKFNAGLEASFDYTHYLREEGIWSMNAAVYPSHVSEERSTWMSKLLEHTVNINKNFGAHTFNAVFGVSQQWFERKFTMGRRSDLQKFNDEYLPTINSGLGEYTAGGGTPVDNFILGYLGRINYIYDDRYLLTLSGRIDKNSRFAEEYRTGIFPSVAAGWRVSEEDFFNVPFISNLKLTGSYGRLGVIPGDVGSWDYIGLLNSDPRAIFGPDQRANIGSYQARIANMQLQWETRVTQNIGLEAGLLDDRVLFSVEVYNSLSEDAILRVPLPAYLGNLEGDPFVNTGSLRNQGVEFTGTYREREGDFTWDVSANFTTIKNTVESVGYRGEGIDYLPTGLTRSKVGRPIAEWYLLKTDGLFQSEQEVLDHVSGNGTVIQPDAQAGDIRFVDVNGDGEITNDDRTYSGKSPWPTLQAGGQFSAAYKNFTINMQLIGVFGNHIYNGTRQILDGYQNTNFRLDIDPWTEEDPDTNDPRIGVATDDAALSLNAGNSDRWLESGSYVRLRNVELGYNIPNSFFGDAGVGQARVYVSGQNILTFTKYSGLDPDVTGNGILERGFDSGNWPSSKVYSVGLQFQF